MTFTAVSTQFESDGDGSAGDDGRVDVVERAGGLIAVRRVSATLISDPDPRVVFGQLARLCVPSVCDEMDVTVLSVEQWQQWVRTAATVEPMTRPGEAVTGGKVAALAAALPTSASAPESSTTSSITVWISSGADATADSSAAAGADAIAGFGAAAVADASTGPADEDAATVDGFVVGVTCTWSRRRPEPFDAALIELLGRYAAVLVREARHRRVLADQRSMVTHLRTALGTNRTIAAAVGILMARHRLSQKAAFELLRTASHRSNRKMAELADTVVLTGELST